MLPTGRRVKYHPESAYWISADVDVPLFLPEFLYSRWLDVHNLVSEARQNGLPPLYGHLMFSSGHEWGYWLTEDQGQKLAVFPIHRELRYLVPFGEPAQGGIELPGLLVLGRCHRPARGALVGGHDADLIPAPTTHWVSLAVGADGAREAVLDVQGLDSRHAMLA